MILIKREFLKDFLVNKGKDMKKLIILLNLFGFIYSQDKVYTFTEEEVTNHI